MFVKKQIIASASEETRPYLIRWAINTPFGGVKLHHILRSDEDRDCHDHPWSFLSIVLRGGYWEHRPKIEQGWCWTLTETDDTRTIAGLVDPGKGCDLCTQGKYRYVDKHGVPFHTMAGGFGASWSGPFKRVKCSVTVRETVRTWYGPGSILWRPRPSVHRLELPTKRVPNPAFDPDEKYKMQLAVLEEPVSAWSLVFTGPKRGTWGFHTMCGWVKHSLYAKAKQEGC
jgi:hypothetical protein